MAALATADDPAGGTAAGGPVSSRFFSTEGHAASPRAGKPSSPPRGKREPLLTIGEKWDTEDARGAPEAGGATPSSATSAAAAVAVASAAVSRKPRENPGFSDFGGLYLGRIPVDSAPSWTVDHLCTSSRDLDTNIARIDSYKVMLKRS